MSAKKPVRKFGGRPAEREVKPGRQAQLSAVIPLPLKRWVEREAKRHQWSVSNETRHLLERARTFADLQFDVYESEGGRRLTIVPTLRSEEKKSEDKK
jgi:hypothetical protein